jgi:hypothetical protein
MAEYQLTATEIVFRVADHTYIPADPANRDYVEYQAWLASGKTPDAYVAPTPPPATKPAPG